MDLGAVTGVGHHRGVTAKAGAMTGAAFISIARDCAVVVWRAMRIALQLFTEFMATMGALFWFGSLSPDPPITWALAWPVGVSLWLAISLGARIMAGRL
jgi:hypothetical protein